MKRSFKKVTRFISVLLALVILCASMPFTMAAGSPLEVSISADKGSYTLFDEMTFTATVTNTSRRTVNDISAQALFGETLSGVKEGSTFNVDELYLLPGESFTFSYKAQQVAFSGLDIMFLPFVLFVNMFRGNTLVNPVDRYAGHGRAVTEATQRASIFSIHSGYYDSTTTVKVYYTGNAPETVYTVSFDLNYDGAHNNIPSQRVIEGETAVEPAAPQREGYTFEGWYSDRNLTHPYDFTTPVTDDIELYAKWSRYGNRHIVTFETNGGSAVDSQLVEHNALVIRPEDPEKEGYRLIAWYADEGLNVVYDFDQPVTTDMTLYASWEALSPEEFGFLDQTPPDVEIYSFDSDYRSVIVGNETMVKFEAEIFTETSLADDEVVIYQDNMIFGTMYDNGENGDEYADDGIYVYQTLLSSEAECTRSYQVKVREAVSETRSIGFYIPMTEEELDGVEIVDNSIKELFASEGFDTFTVDERAAMFVDLLNMLADNGLVVEGSIYYDLSENSVYYKYATGASGVVALEERNGEYNSVGSDTKSKTDKHEAVNMYATYSELEQATTYNDTRASNTRNVLVLNGFENDSFRRDYYRNLEREWDAMGLNTTVDVNVTVADMKALDASGWDVIVFAMHGSKWRTVPGQNKRPVLCINEVPTTATDLAYDYELNHANTVVKVSYKDGTSGYYITPQFFTDTYNATAFDGKMFFSETCMFYGCDCQTTTPDYTLANAITGRSAEVVVGYHNSVEANYSRDVMKIVIEESFNGASISSAVNTAKQSEGEDDDCRILSKHKYEAYPLIAGRGGFVLRPDGFVRGSVKSADTSSAIGNALIRAYDQNDDEVASTRSDSSGSYSLSLPAGTYTFEISAGSYKKAKISVVVNSEGTTYVETLLLVSNFLNIGSINGTITNAVTEGPVSNVIVKFRKSWNNKTGLVVASTQTNTNGYYEVDDLDVGLYTMEYYKSGYVTGYKNVFVLFGSTQNAVISPVASEGVYRVVLTWGANPSDLDSHLFGYPENGSSYHIYFGNQNAYSNGEVIANLDVDDVTSYGPETTTFVTDANGDYAFYIDWFSGSGTWASCGGKVKVYNGDSLVAEYDAPNDNSRSGSWKVFSIENGTLISYNTISSDIF